MGKVTIEGTAKTPTVNFDPDNAVMELKGRSIPENSIEFYKPVVDALDEYVKAPQSVTKVNIELEYFNTASSKCILDLFKKLEGIIDTGNEVVINWYYEEDDEDMLEAGEDYEAIIKVPFKMIEIED